LRDLLLNASGSSCLSLYACLTKACQSKFLTPLSNYGNNHNGPASTKPPNSPSNHLANSSVCLLILFKLPAPFTLALPLLKLPVSLAAELVIPFNVPSDPKPSTTCWPLNVLSFCVCGYGELGDRGGDAADERAKYDNCVPKLCAEDDIEAEGLGPIATNKSEYEGLRPRIIMVPFSSCIKIDANPSDFPTP
jgi:hypothetical protein